MTVAGDANKGYSSVGGPAHCPGADKTYNGFGHLRFYVRLIYSCYIETKYRKIEAIMMIIAMDNMIHTNRVSFTIGCRKIIGISNSVSVSDAAADANNSPNDGHV